MNKLTVILMIIILCSELVSGREHIHIFTSKGIYETSEDLWFKGIAIDDSTMRVSDRSHTAYVEIIGEKHQNPPCVTLEDHPGNQRSDSRDCHYQIYKPVIHIYLTNIGVYCYKNK